MSARYVAAFPQRSEYEKTRSVLDARGLPYGVIEPGAAFGRVGCPALVLDQETRACLATDLAGDVTCSGWVDFRPAATAVPEGTPPVFSEDIFGSASAMLLAPCIADDTKIRLIAHISGDITTVFPYLNALMSGAVYNEEGPTLTFMEGYRMVTLYPRRITIAKADDLVDGWRVLEAIRCRVNRTYERRDSITPLYKRREKPPAVVIYKKLPGTNCGQCGQKTCMAFALGLWNGSLNPFLCKPVFEEDFAHLRDDFRETCVRLGFTADAGFSDQ